MKSLNTFIIIVLFVFALSCSKKASVASSGNTTNNVNETTPEYEVKILSVSIEDAQLSVRAESAGTLDPDSFKWKIGTETYTNRTEEESFDLPYDDSFTIRVDLMVGTVSKAYATRSFEVNEVEISGTFEYSSSDKKFYVSIEDDYYPVTFKILNADTDAILYESTVSSSAEKAISKSSLGSLNGVYDLKLVALEYQGLSDTVEVDIAEIEDLALGTFNHTITLNTTLSDGCDMLQTPDYLAEDLPYGYVKNITINYSFGAQGCSGSSTLNDLKWYIESTNNYYDFDYEELSTSVTSEIIQTNHTLYYFELVNYYNKELTISSITVNYYNN